MWSWKWILCVCTLTLGWGNQGLMAIDRAIPAIRGDVSRAKLGDGTGVVIGVVDSGVDSNHPALRGVDSLGRPRLVAQENFVVSEPRNTGNDVFGHGTKVLSAAVSSDARYTGMAPDARYVNSRVLDSSNRFPNDQPIKDGIGFALENGADILNLSLNFTAPNSNGNSQLDLMVDWAAYDRGVSSAICVGNVGSEADAYKRVRGPGSTFNGIAVGRTTASFTRVDPLSATATTSDGRMKPDLVAPGDNLTLANNNWEGIASDWTTSNNGCSYAAPLISGMLAQQIEAGKSRGWNTSPLVLKTTLMSSTDEVLNGQGSYWRPALLTLQDGVLKSTQPLDTQSGAGQVRGDWLAEQYLAGERAPGVVPSRGWDFSSVTNGQSMDYVIDNALIAGGTLTVALAWHRHVGRIDDGDGVIDAGDVFTQIQELSELNLQVLKNGDPIAISMSPVDNVQFLRLENLEQGQYTLRVQAEHVALGSEDYAISWSGVAVPEPSSLLLLCMTAIPTLACQAHRRKKGQHKLQGRESVS